MAAATIDKCKVEASLVPDHFTTSTYKDVDIFNRDAAQQNCYGYTLADQLSSRFATARSADEVLRLGNFANCSLLDVGCGDGYFTLQYRDRGNPTYITALDAAPEALKVAGAATGGSSISFTVADGARLPYRNDSFDVVLLQSVLHHAADPENIVREAFRVAPRVVIHDPNGNNLGLKIIEKTSRYHIDHNERSYRPHLLRKWVKNAGGVVTAERFAGFVPMFCPDFVARLMKSVEGLLEATPIARALGCSVYTMVGQRHQSN